MNAGSERSGSIFHETAGCGDFGFRPFNLLNYGNCPNRYHWDSNANN
jgi:hypothetical protein